jgi:hypothetical protein
MVGDSMHPCHCRITVTVQMLKIREQLDEIDHANAPR